MTDNPATALLLFAGLAGFILAAIGLAGLLWRRP